MWLCPLGAISLIGNARICPIYQTWMTLRELLIMNSHCSQTHGLGKVMGTEALEAFGPSNVYCSLGPSGANVVMVDGQGHHPWRYPLWENLLDGQT